MPHPGARDPIAVRGQRGAVACGHPLAAEAARDALAAGGTAADAALAAAWVLAVILPDACGVGGDAMILVRSADGSALALNGSGAAPEGLVPPVPEDGPATAAVPGFTAALADLHRRHGRLSWAAAITPAARLAADGTPLGEPLAAALGRHRDRLARWSPGWALDGAAPGALVRHTELAATLERIAADGPDGFYGGETAARLDAAMRAAGAPMRAADLSAHQSVVRRPVPGGYRDAGLVVQPPVSQALIALMVLGALERERPDGAADRVHVAVEAVDAAFARRDEIALPGAVSRLLGLPLEIRAEHAARGRGPRDHDHTTAIATADTSGLVISMLVSVFDEFGCAAVVPGAGFLLNDRLKGFASDPESPNAAAPGRRPVHTLSPALVEHEGRVFALATPGADAQVQVIAQVVDALAGDGEVLDAALARPRWRSMDGRLAVEGGFHGGVIAELADRGHAVELAPRGDALFGAAVTAGLDAAGRPFAIADGRRETAALAL